MGRIYATDGKILCETPQIQIGDKLYAVDIRKSTYDKMQEEIKKGQKSEEDIILEYAFGKSSLQEIKKLDLSIGGFMNLITFVYAAMFDITFEEAQTRFQKAAK